MRFNQEMIVKYMDEYKESYYKQFNQQPKSWFTYIQWLADISPAGSFNSEDIELAKGLFK